MAFRICGAFQTAQTLVDVCKLRHRACLDGDNQHLIFCGLGPCGAPFFFFFRQVVSAEQLRSCCILSKSQSAGVALPAVDIQLQVSGVEPFRLRRFVPGPRRVGKRLTHKTACSHCTGTSYVRRKGKTFISIISQSYLNCERSTNIFFEIFLFMKRSQYCSPQTERLMDSEVRSLQWVLSWWTRQRNFKPLGAPTCLTDKQRGTPRCL